MIIKKISLMHFILFLLLLLFGSSACFQSNQDPYSNIEEQMGLQIENIYTEPLSPIPDESFDLTVTLANYGKKEAVYNAVLDILEIVGQNRINRVEIEKRITIGAGDKMLVEFDGIYLQEGEYLIVIGNLEKILKIQCS